MVDVANFAARNFGYGPDLAQIDLQRTRNALGQQQLQQEAAMGPLRQQAAQQQIDYSQANEQRIQQQTAQQDQAAKIQWLHGASKWVLDHPDHPEAWNYVVTEGKQRGIIPQDFNAQYDPAKLQDFVNQIEVMQGGVPEEKITAYPANSTLYRGNQQIGTTAPAQVTPYQQQTLAETVRHNQATEAAATTKLSGGGVDTSDPIVQSWMQAVLGGNATMQQVPNSHRDSVALGLSQMPSSAYSPQAASRFSAAANRISSNYVKLPQYELTANGLPYLQRIDAALKTPGSVSDQDLLDSLTKLNTAGNAITDAQVRLITDGKSWADTANTFANKFRNGGVLSNNQREQIHSIANAIFDNYKKGYQPVYDQVTRQLKASGIPEPFWGVPDLNKLSEQAQATQLSPSGSFQGAAAPSGEAPEGTVISNGTQTLIKRGGQWVPQ